ncbi:MAG: cation:proton antiporter [Fimbriimonas sp.]
MAFTSTVLRRLPLTTSLLYMAVGVVVGPLGYGLITIDPTKHSLFLERLTELAVVISLFTAGLKMRAPFHDRRWLPPVRLASLTMLASIGAVTALGYFLFGLPLGAAVLLGALLAPTDPVLASDVQVERAADRDRLRFSLTGEAGLNDGTAFPFVMLGLGLLGHHHLGPNGLRWLGVDLIWATAAGIGIGWLLGQAVGRITLHLRHRHENAVGYEDFLALGLVALSYGIALMCHAYGFLAVFAAGLSLRHLEMRRTGPNRNPEEVLEEASGTLGENLATDPSAGPAYMAHAVLGFSEQLERILEVTVVLIVGALLTYAEWSWRSALFVVAMLFLVRPLAVYATFYGKGTSGAYRPYVAWFGIRGIGSLYYLFYAMQHGLPEGQAKSLVGITLTMVAVSIVIHGTTVTPLMKRYGANMEAKANGKTPVLEPASTWQEG